MPLCSKCRRISTAVLEPGYPMELNKTIYTHNVSSLIDSARTGCFFCTQAWNSLDEGQKNFLRAERTQIQCTAGYDDRTSSDQSVQVRFNFPQEIRHPRPFVLELHRLIDTFTLLKFNGTRRVASTLSSFTGDNASLTLITAWLQNCERTHVTCRYKSHNKKFLPTRLVDVGGAPSELFWVVESRNLPARDDTKYLALSHCWGTRAFLTNTKANRQRFEEGIGLKELPLNFRDAIYATRRLGFRYIWIDTLCILQDQNGDKGDWFQEAPSMNLIYGNATLTLAAAASSDAYGGLFRHRDPVLVAPYGIHCNLQIGHGSGHPGRYQSLFHAVPTSSGNHNVAYTKLNRRAWVVQERVLSPRTVYFSNNQIWWECREVEANESFPEVLPDALKTWGWYGRSLKAWGAGRADGNLARAVNPLSDPYGTWKIIRATYTVCGLTKPGDKLVAISGLAKHFAPLLNDEYVAGLWRKRITSELLWHHESQSTVKRRPSTYRAPSWSWASVDAKVLYSELDPHDSMDCIDIIDVKITPVGTDITAGVQNAVIELRGYLVAIPAPTVQRTKFEDEGWSLYLDAPEETSRDKAYYCLPVRRSDHIISGVSDEVLWGLVLQHQTNTKATFQRVGAFSVSKGFQVSSVGQDKIHTHSRKLLSAATSIITGKGTEGPAFDSTQPKIQIRLV